MDKDNTDKKGSNNEKDTSSAPMPPPLTSITIEAPANTAETTSSSAPATSPTAEIIPAASATPMNTPIPSAKKTAAVKPCLVHAHSDHDGEADDEMDEDDAKPKHHHAHFQNNGGGGDSSGIMVTSAKKVLKKKKKKAKSLTWDEHAIEEHDLLRGTRMKIDEPNTPFTHYDYHSEASDSDTQASASSLVPHATTDGNTTTTKTEAKDGTAKAKRQHRPRSPSHEDQQNNNKANLAMHWDALESKLESVAASRIQQDGCPSSPSAASASSSGAISDEDKKKKHAEFEKRRKAHYNEVEAMRRFRVEHPEGLTDEEDDE